MVSSIAAAYEKNMDFSFTTSTGDKVNLNLSLAESASASEDDQSLVLEWMREMRTEMTIEGNGLTDEDLREIDEMMEMIQPSIDSFFASEDSPVQETINTIKQAIPPMQPQPMADALATQTLDYGINALEEPKSDIKREMQDIKAFYEELLKTLEENRPLDLNI